MRDNHVKNLSLIDELRLTNMAKLTKKEQEKIKLEEEKKSKNRQAVQKHRKKKKNEVNITLSLNSIALNNLIKLREKLGYSPVSENEKGGSEIYSRIIGYLLKYEADSEPPETHKSQHIRELYRRHRIAKYWRSIDELSDYGAIQEINAMGISNIDYYHRQVMNWDISESSPEWTPELLRDTANLKFIKKYVSTLKAQKTRIKNQEQ